MSEVLALAELTPGEPRSQTRGAAHEAFSFLFAQPFDEAAIASYRPLSPPPNAGVRDASAAPVSKNGTRRTLGLVGVGAGALGLGVGAYFALRASSSGARDATALSNAAAAAQNERVSRFDTSAIVAFSAGGVLTAVGAALLLWPSAPSVRVAWTPLGGVVGTGGTF